MYYMVVDVTIARLALETKGFYEPAPDVVVTD
jgi:hypothetical protein